ncbi:MAG: amidase [Actinomycetia bacterium]|nr:amidase [Actinomycetes bacterium]MCP4960722.1 amidase [Actinomycetes bacterium]
MTPEVAYSSAIEQAAAVAAREVSSRELVLAAASRIAEMDTDVNSVVRVDIDAALAAAAEADSAVAAGQDLGPLHGVPLTIKDSFQTKGLITTSGAPELADFVPEVDADPVARYRSAGAVVLGKTNLPIWAGDVQSFNDVYGTTSNPYDLRRSPGGSSGGSAAALAAGLTPLEIGSDIGGSIRNPAGMTGVVGHKPSYGLCSARGQIPGMPGTLTQADIAVVGPMARTVDDVELGLDLLTGPDDWHATAWSAELPPARTTDPKKLRVGAWLDDPGCPVSAEVVALLETAVRSLDELGAAVDVDTRPTLTFEKSVRTFDELIGAALSGGWSLSELEEMAQRDHTQGGLGVAHAAQRHRSWLASNERRLQLRKRWREFFTEHDVMIMPVSPRPAIEHDHSMPLTKRTIDVDGEARPYTDLMAWMGLTGVVYLPATVVPVGLTADGLPVGAQIVGPFLEDRTPIAVARMLEQTLGGFRRPQGF